MHKLRNILAEIEYDGTNYRGWQTQPSKTKRKKRSLGKTVQATIEEALSKLLQEKIKLISSGRTDAGVHAKAQKANFLTTSFFSLKKLMRALNALLPLDIRIKKLKQVPVDFHAQFAVKSKTYRYTILNRKIHCVFNRDFVLHVPAKLNIPLMSREAKVLQGRHNFKSFQATDKKERNPVRTIKKIKVRQNKGHLFIDLEADGFVYHMVRNIVGTLLEIGRKGTPEGMMKKILKAKDRRKAGPTAAAKGLCLLKVKY